MCLAIPAQIMEIDHDTDSAVVSVGGIRKSISLALVDDVKEGEFVLVHVGYALSRVSESEAAKTLALFEEAGLKEAGG